LTSQEASQHLNHCVKSGLSVLNTKDAEDSEEEIKYDEAGASRGPKNWGGGRQQFL